MKYLLDTNIFLWWLDDDKKLKPTYRQLIGEKDNVIYISIATAWEISIKHKIGKLHLKTSLQTCFKKYNFEILQITLDHIFMLHTLPLYHRDPFDRILIAQAKVEKLTVLTADPKFTKYAVAFK